MSGKEKERPEKAKRTAAVLVEVPRTAPCDKCEGKALPRRMGRQVRRMLKVRRKRAHRDEEVKRKIVCKRAEARAPKDM